jgi:hypothetical protein
MTWFRMFDPEPKGVFPVEPGDAEHWNVERWGVFSTVNAFAGARRKENLTAIRAWAVDIDDGEKQAQADRIQHAPLLPSRVVETKRGYQAHWFAKPGAKPEHWDALVLERLVPYFGADKNARDLCRILRVPGYLHWKDPANPFAIRRVLRLDVSYTERQIAEAFPWVPSRERHQEQLAEAQRQAKAREREAARASGSVPSESLWDAIYNLDQREALERLSGSAVVDGQVYTFRRTSRHRHNVLVDGKGSSCFVDEGGKIGSLSKGGPTVVQWCRWLGKGYAEILAALKHAFPHLAEVDAARARGRR